ncbi:DNA primase [Streptomyces sp. NPDC096205]|uniref:DNA primase n=1 Tax=Streptomyces sp. NPDC096205 TaxID=3366081 RepID=UPI0038081971
MSRAGLGLAVGAGYLLGRTKKLKMAIAVGTFVAGRRMNVGPRAIADLVSGQLRNNPQFKELGDQLRGDLRGVGKAASSAMIERQLDTLAGRLHDRTAETRDRLAGVVPGADESESADESENDEEERAARGTRSHEDQEPEETAEASDKRDAEEPAASESSGSGSRARKSTAPAKKAGARKTAAKKTTRGAKAAGSAAKTASGARRPKGGGDR